MNAETTAPAHDPRETGCRGPMYCATCQDARQSPARRPDLSSLPADTRINVVLAELVDGAEWEPTPLGYWLCVGRNDVLFTKDGSAASATADFRDYLNHDEASWSLMERETDGYDTYPRSSVTGPFRCWWYTDAGLIHRVYGPFAETLARAVAMAVLTKNAAGPLADVIRPLLQEVSR